MKKSCRGKNDVLKPSLPMGNLLNFGLSSRSSRNTPAVSLRPEFGYVKAVNASRNANYRTAAVCAGGVERTLKTGTRQRPKCVFKVEKEKVTDAAEYDAPWEGTAVSKCLATDRLLGKSPPKAATMTVEVTNDVLNEGCAYDEPWESKSDRLLAENVDLLLRSSFNTDPRSDDQCCPSKSLLFSCVACDDKTGSVASPAVTYSDRATITEPPKGSAQAQRVTSSVLTGHGSAAVDVVTSSSDNCRTCDRWTQTDVLDRRRHSPETAIVTRGAVVPAAVVASKPVPPLRNSVLKNRVTAASGGTHSHDSNLADVSEVLEPAVAHALNPIHPQQPRTKLYPAEHPGVQQESVAAHSVQYDVPWEFCCADFHISALLPSGQDARTMPKIRPAELRVTGSGGGCSGVIIERDKIASAIVNSSLAKQEWFHGVISRAEAERRLRSCPQGSFLVRVCEGCKVGREYALSVRHLTGFMHMKIQLNQDKKWILGYFSQPFDSVPQMLRYYASNKLPIKGAEHITLMQPVVDQVV